MSARVWLFGVWALAAASAVTWGLRLGARPLAVPVDAVLAQGGAAPRGDWTRVLGADAPPTPVAAAAAPVADARFVLLGVISPRPAGASGQGLALIAVDDRPARAFRVGAVVDGDRVLQSVGPRSATIGPTGGPAQVSLSLPPVAEAARGVPTPAGAVPGVFAAPVPGHTPGQMPAQMQMPAPFPAPAPLPVAPPAVLPPGAYPLPGQPSAATPRPLPGAVDVNGAALR